MSTLTVTPKLAGSDPRIASYRAGVWDVRGGESTGQFIAMATPAAATFHDVKLGETYVARYAAYDAQGEEIAHVDEMITIPGGEPPSTPPVTRAEMDAAILAAIKARDAVILAALARALKRKYLNARQLAKDLSAGLEA